MDASTDTIVAQATPVGIGGVGIIRISGTLVPNIAHALIGDLPSPRKAHYAKFKAFNGDTIDMGIALYFAKPHSFTGEDVLELQGHGGPVILDELLQTIIQCGARLAKPGEFSERAFLNDKIDLTQAEAVADLIESTSQQAARCAIRSLQGEFAEHIQALVSQLIHLRTFVEAAIDFPEEEIDFISDQRIRDQLSGLQQQLQFIQAHAKQGQLLREGIHIVIAGKPNAGKSSLLNKLSGKNVAIVTDIPGTTRDLLREHISLDGIPLHIIDTAGLRESPDSIELEGMQRAQQEIQQADRLLLLIDDQQEETAQRLEDLWPAQIAMPPAQLPVTVIHNKIDLSGETARIETRNGMEHVFISVKENMGIDLLRQQLKQQAGFDNNIEGCFSARRRHLDALEQAQQSLNNAEQQLITYKAGELAAEELRLTQQALGSITGEYTADDLLGEIFSSFCIGK